MEKRYNLYNLYNLHNLYNLEPSFKEYLLSVNISLTSLKNYLSDFRHFSGWIIGNSQNVISNSNSSASLTVESLITANNISEYKSYLVSNNIPHKTINRRLSTVRKFCIFCISQGWMKNNPAKKINNVINPKISQNFQNKEAQLIDPIQQNHKALYSPISIFLLMIINRISHIINSILGRIKNKNVTDSNQPQLSFGIRYYIGLIIILIFVAIMGAGIYNKFFLKSENSFAYSTSPTRAGRILSFQGRLTDALSNPIVTATNLKFRLYNVSTGGTALYDTGSCSLTPDQDGIFNVLVGASGHSPTPPQSVCGTEIGSSIFSENSDVYLGVTVASDAEMTPRQQIANVGYAINSETLQGLSPGTNVSSIPYINSDGNLLIAAAAPGIRSIYTSSDFTLSSAKAAIIQSAGAGDVIIQATESGVLKFRTTGTTDAYNRLVINNAGEATFSSTLSLGPITYIDAGICTTASAGKIYFDGTDNKLY